VFIVAGTKYIGEVGSREAEASSISFSSY